MDNFPESGPAKDEFDEIVDGFYDNMIMHTQGGPMPDDLREQHDQIESINTSLGQASIEKHVDALLLLAKVLG